MPSASALLDQRSQRGAQQGGEVGPLEAKWDRRGHVDTHDGIVMTSQDHGARALEQSIAALFVTSTA